MVYIPNTRWTLTFMAIVTVQLGVVLAFEAFAFGKFIASLSEASFDQNYKYTRTIPTFLTLYIFGGLYQLVLTWDGLRLKNTIQIIGLCIYNLGLLVYGAVQIASIQEATSVLAGTTNFNSWPEIRPYLIALPCVLGAGTVAMSFVARALYDEFAWTIYKHISADVAMRRRYLTYQIYITLLKFDFAFFLGFTIQFLVVVDNFFDVEFGLTVAAVPVTIVILLFAAYWVRHENKVGTLFTILIYIAGAVYYIYKLVRIYNGNKVPYYLPVRRPLTAFAALTLILIVMTIINAIACYMNFGQGLRPFIARRKPKDEDEKAYNVEMNSNMAHSKPPARMTIE